MDVSKSQRRNVTYANEKQFKLQLFDLYFVACYYFLHNIPLKEFLKNY